GIRLPQVTFEDFRGEQLLVPEHPHHIVIAGDEPHRILGIPVNRVLLTQAVKIGIGIGDDLWSKQIVIDSRYHATSSLPTRDAPPASLPCWVCPLSRELLQFVAVYHRESDSSTTEPLHIGMVGGALKTVDDRVTHILDCLQKLPLPAGEGTGSLSESEHDHATSRTPVVILSAGDCAARLACPPGPC